MACSNKDSMLLKKNLHHPVAKAIIINFALQCQYPISTNFVLITLFLKWWLDVYKRQGSFQPYSSFNIEPTILYKSWVIISSNIDFFLLLQTKVINIVTFHKIMKVNSPFNMGCCILCNLNFNNKTLILFYHTMLTQVTLSGLSPWITSQTSFILIWNTISNYF